MRSRRPRGGNIPLRQLGSPATAFRSGDGLPGIRVTGTVVQHWRTLADLRVPISVTGVYQDLGVPKARLVRLTKICSGASGHP
jgi:hypothetical protein